VSESVATTNERPTIARPSPAIQLVRLRKVFEGVKGETVVAVDDVDLEIGEGEFFSLLGPSGSGKTTVLRMIAGFEMPTGGAVLLQGRDVTRLAPYDRDVNTVFQDYALFPHLTVQKNVEYGLKVKGVGKAERRRRAGEMLESVRLAGFGNRSPAAMSGGQRQRVALARALVNRPKVLLLDEPLGALDLKLREEMQVELKTIQHEVGITFVFVTHDQGEALSMSSRVAVFNNGRIEQVGTPREIYEQPATAFVAGFVGTSNLLGSELSERLLGSARAHTIRPERVHVRDHMETGAHDHDHDHADDEVVVEGVVVGVQYLGAESRVTAALADGTKIVATVASARLGSLAVDGPITLGWSRRSCVAVNDSARPLLSASAVSSDPDHSQGENS